MASPKTLYQIGDTEIRQCIDVYIELSAASDNFARVRPEHLRDERARAIAMAGFGIPPHAGTIEDICDDLQRRSALHFDLEGAISTCVYSVLRSVAEQFYDELHRSTNGFASFDVGYLFENPRFLPILQHVCRVFSKAHLRAMAESG